VDRIRNVVSTRGSCETARLVGRRNPSIHPDWLVVLIGLALIVRRIGRCERLLCNVYHLRREAPAGEPIG